MNGSSNTRRILSMHPAHRRIGVSGGSAAFHPYCPIVATAAEPIRVLLVSRPADAGASAGLAALESIVRRQPEFECERIDFDARIWNTAGGRFRYDADCMVLFSRGLRVIRRAAEFDSEALAEKFPTVSDGSPADVTISPFAPWHPVLDRVGSFVAQGVSGRFDAMPENATCLLMGKTDGHAFPVAWASDFPGRIFHSLLGAAADFRQPDFVQLALNAIEWAGS